MMSLMSFGSKRSIVQSNWGRARLRGDELLINVTQRLKGYKPFIAAVLLRPDVSH